jgi:hypothetical protein
MFWQEDIQRELLARARAEQRERQPVETRLLHTGYLEHKHAVSTRSWWRPLHGEREAVIRNLALVIAAGWWALGFAVFMSAGMDRLSNVPPRYTAAALREQLGIQPATVVGRTLYVQGIVQTCGPYDTAPPYCLAPAPPSNPAVPIDPFPLVWATPHPLQRWLAGLPLLGALVPMGQPVFPGQVGTYPLRLRVQTNGYCGEPVCYEGLLLDAAPPT